jgi:hypothetical protein
MKANFYIGIISALLLAGSPMAAQIADNGFRSDNSGLVINNYYYNDYDYYFASRINRFHREYAAFDYYSPVFTDTYFYTYNPFSWGISIYGRGGFGFGVGYAYRYPSYSYGWYDPYYGSNWYWGYNPYFYSYDPYFYSWYSPVIININIRNRWRPWYSGWYGHNPWFNDYRPVYHSQNYYNNSSSRYYSRDINERKGPAELNRSNSGGQSRRTAAPAITPGRRIESSTPSRNQTSSRVTTNQSLRTQSSTVRSTTSRVQVSKSSSPPAGRSSVTSSSRSGRSAGTSFRSSSSRSSGSTSKSSSSKSSSKSGKRR